jgi:Spy/CpxP family protein refolding chaperone
MRTARTVLTLTLALLITSPLWAADAKKKAEKKAPPNPAAERIKRMTEGLTLTDEQKAKLDATAKECCPMFIETWKKSAAVLTDEQKKARSAAEKEAKAAGKKGKEFHAAVDAAINLSDDQKAKLADVRKEMGSLEKQLNQKVMAVLTDDQKAQLKALHKSKKAAEKK